jgi:hypothetical protein
MAFRQCPKRLWLEINKPELRDDSGSQTAFAAGHQVGEAAQAILDREGDGINIDPPPNWLGCIGGTNAGRAADSGAEQSLKHCYKSLERWHWRM